MRSKDIEIAAAVKLSRRLVLAEENSSTCVSRDFAVLYSLAYPICVDILNAVSKLKPQS